MNKILTFSYKAKDIQGRIFAGQLQSASRQSVISELKRKGYYLLGVQVQNRFSTILSGGFSFGGRVSTKEKGIFTHQLAVMLKAGMKLTTALKTLSKQTKSKYLSSVSAQLHDDIEQSSSLSQAMSRHPKVFPEVYTAIVAAAEQSGTLAETLTVLSNQLKTQASVNSRIKSALIYPVFLLFVSALVVAILMTFVIPKFIELFVNANQALPLPTKVLIWITDSLKDFWWLLLLLLTAGAALLTTSLKNKHFKLAFDSLVLRLPLFGILIRKLQLARFARTLGWLLDGGVRILSAVNITRSTAGNNAFAREIEQIEECIVKGMPLAKAMSQQRYFGEMMVNMVAVGEDTGTIDQMLLEIADIYDQESESILNALTTLLGPLMILILGLIIGFVVLAILMPIFETSTIIS